MLLAAGSAAIGVALVRAGVFRARSGAAVALALWVAGLVGVVLFEKHNWSAGPSISGDVHRAASLLAFLSLPVAAVLAGRPWLRRLWSAGQRRGDLAGGLRGRRSPGYDIVPVDRFSARARKPVRSSTRRTAPCAPVSRNVRPLPSAAL